MGGRVREFRGRDLLLGGLLVFSIVYVPLVFAGPDGGCLGGGADFGVAWDARVQADADADRVVVYNTGPNMGQYDRTAALLLQVRGDGETKRYVLARDRAFRSDAGLPFPAEASRSVTGVRVAGRDLQSGDTVAVVHRSSRMASYCLRTVDQRTLTREEVG